LAWQDRLAAISNFVIIIGYWCTPFERFFVTWICRKWFCRTVLFMSYIIMIHLSYSI
jgi:hypothetical protein